MYLVNLIFFVIVNDYFSLIYYIDVVVDDCYGVIDNLLC